MKQVLLLFFISILSISLQAQSDNGKILDQSALTVYPNPAVEYISINDTQETIKQVAIYNLIGRKMKSFVASPEKKYLISELPKGLYLIQLLDKNNKVVTTQRVSKR